jgi:prepilin peptidase CpaA
MAFPLDDQRPPPACDLRSKARAGDAAADDNDVEIAHFGRWLRIGKPHRLGVAVMFYGGFTELLLMALATILVVAAVIDLRTFTISNRLSLAVALGAPLYWLSMGLAPWPGMAIQLAAGGIVFALLAGAFYAGMMGGGDVKLAAALALWFPPAGTIKFLVVMSIAGGVLTLGILVWHRARRKVGSPKIPYGVAIAAGALFVLAPILTQRFLNQFV